QVNTFPVSYAQQRMWFLEQIAPNSAVCTIPEGIRLSGRLDRQALERTLEALIERHEALRTVFPALGGRPVQVVEPLTARSWQLRVHDLSEEPAAEREARTRQLITQEIHRPFDLARGPLFRPLLLRLAMDEH